MGGKATFAVLCILVLISGAEAKILGIKIMPDHPLYFLERVVDRLEMILARDEEAKAKIALANAEERLEEISYMRNRSSEAVKRLEISYRKEVKQAEKLEQEIPMERKEEFSARLRAVKEHRRIPEGGDELEFLDELAERYDGISMEGIPESLEEVVLGRIYEDGEIVYERKAEIKDQRIDIDSEKNATVTVEMDLETLSYIYENRGKLKISDYLELIGRGKIRVEPKSKVLDYLLMYGERIDLDSVWSLF